MNLISHYYNLLPYRFRAARLHLVLSVNCKLRPEFYYKTNRVEQLARHHIKKWSIRWLWFEVSMDYWL